MSINAKEFKNPSNKFCANPIIHHWPDDEDARIELMNAVKEYGYGGVVTNPRQQNGFTSNSDNIAEFAEILSGLQERELSYWIYDECGYPSGYAGGKTLEGHPELEAKGFYMTRRIAYTPKHSTFKLDDESDKIIWAAKYPVDCSNLNASIVQFNDMEPVPFTDSYAECDLKENEVFYVFAAKSCYEGTHCTHNAASHSRYINVMDKRAVRRFIDLCYEPIVDKIPEAYSNADAVFTDEPSLQVGYMHGYEEWPYALAPWVDGLFEEYEQEYGESLKPWLPLLFEGQAYAYPIRIKFYNLVGKLISRSYSSQLAEWCKAHGGKFSGHYLAEESIHTHVKHYGNYMEVLKHTSYPGIDVLACMPEIYNYNTAKFPQLAARKMDANGMMVEICPYINVSEFTKNAFDNMSGVMNMLFLGGTRVTNSYFRPDFADYSPKKLKEFTGYMKSAEANQFNKYIGRIAYMLDGIQNDCGTFVYYALEDVQAKFFPRHHEIKIEESDTDVSILSVTRKIYEAGHDYSFADREEIVKAAKNLKKGQKAKIFSSMLETIIIPAIDVMYADARNALVELQKAGVKVLFVDKLPQYDAEKMADFQYYNFREEAFLSNDLICDDDFTAVSSDIVLDTLDLMEKDFNAVVKDTMILKARYDHDGMEMHFVVNNSRKSVDVLLTHINKTEASLYDPENGNVSSIRLDDTVEIKPYRGIFILFDR